MGIFSAIKDAIFGHPAAAQAAPAPAPAPQLETAGAPAAAQPAPAPEPKIIDADAALENIWESKGRPDLNYKESIVDLMKLIGMDSSLDNRKQLAEELGYEGEKNGSAEMNLWLHHRVMERIRTGKS